MIKNNKLTLERLKKTLSYDEISGKFIRIYTDSYKFKCPCDAGTINKILGYVYIGIDTKIYLGHILAWFYYYGEYPEISVDHINGNRADNRISNLRLATMSENLLNREKQANNSSGYKNVSYSKCMKSWEVRMNINKKRILVGYFEDKKLANKEAINFRIKNQGKFCIENRKIV